MRFQYVLQEILQGLRRNLTMVIAVVVSTAVALVMLGSGLLMWQQTLHMQDYWYGKVEVSVFMCNPDDAGKYSTCQTAVTEPQKQSILQAAAAHSARADDHPGDAGRGLQPVPATCRAAR